MSIRDLPVRAKKKGKTRGRPSKEEIIISKIISEKFIEKQGEIDKSIKEMFCYGNAMHSVNWEE